MEPNRDPPPFWSPPPSIRRHRISSPPFISLPVLIVLLPTLALILLFFAIRAALPLTSQLFRPSSVKKGWDSFNVFLVLFAIICGIFVRRNDDVPIAAAADVGNSRGSDQRTVGFYDSARRTAAVPTRKLGRNSSYPDLRQESPWGTGNEVNQFRFFDDFEVDRFRSRSFANRRRGNEIEESPAEIQVIPDVSIETQSPPPPPPVTQRKSRRTYQTIQKEEEEVREVSANKAEFAKSQSPPPPPPLPPRAVIPPSPVRVRLEEKFGKSGRKKTNVKKEIAMALGSLYRKRKKKQKPTNIDDVDHRSTAEQQPLPPPPPPPPPPSLFRGLFKKSNKNKRVHSESAPPPPPPPPPAPLSSRSTNKKSQMPPPPSPPPPSWQRKSTANRRPPLPARVPNSSIVNEVIPPPPPPPPFRTMTAMESVVRGDSVGSRSSKTAHCGSPKPENIEPSSVKEATDQAGGEDGGGGGVGPVFCPSPDVNIKAADFIARLRGEWRLEKMNSVREKERLGQGPNPEILMGLGPNPETLMGLGPNV